MTILKQYTSPQAILDAYREILIKIISSNSRKGLKYSENLYEKLILIAQEALYIDIKSCSLFVKLTNTISLIETLETQLQCLRKEIHSLVKSCKLPETFIKSIQLIYSISGIGELTAITIMSKIGDINGFLKPKHLIVNFGINPSVNQSGKFNSYRNKMSKRGTRFGRRALYATALASVRPNKNSEPINEVLLKYYKENLKGKKKKVALGAVMNKLLK